MFGKAMGCSSGADQCHRDGRPNRGRRGRRFEGGLEEYSMLCPPRTDGRLQADLEMKNFSAPVTDCFLLGWLLQIFVMVARFILRAGRRAVPGQQATAVGLHDELST